MAYWQNNFHHLDPPQPPSEDAFLTFYHTFANLSTQVIKVNKNPTAKSWKCLHIFCDGLGLR